MGVDNMKKIITRVANECIEQKSYDDFNGMCIAIDTFIVIYKAIDKYRGFTGGSDKVNIRGEIVTHLEYILDKTIKLHKHGITSLWIFDGKYPDLKKEELAKRKQEKQILQSKYEASPNYDPLKPIHRKNFTINKTILANLYKLLSLMGVSYITAINEAEGLGSHLNKNSIVSGLITEDWDALPFGCQNLIKNFNTKENLYAINAPKLLTALGINHEQLIDLCILLGTDYCPTITGLSGLKAYYMYYEFKDIPTLVNHLKIINANCSTPKYIIPENYIERWLKAKEYYLSSQKEIITRNIIWRKPKRSQLITFLCDECLFERKKVIQSVNALMVLYFDYVGKKYNYKN